MFQRRRMENVAFDSASELPTENHRSVGEFNSTRSIKACQQSSEDGDLFLYFDNLGNRPFPMPTHPENWQQKASESGWVHTSH